MKRSIYLFVFLLFPCLLLAQSTVVNRNGKEISVGSNFYLSGGTTDAGTEKTNSIYRLGDLGIGTSTPANKLEINHGTAGFSGLRFTNLNSNSTANTSSGKVLGLNATGDVILTNVPGTQNIVAFSVNANTNTAGTTFSPNTPNDQSVVYQSAIDNSLWTYNGSAYVTYTTPSSTAWFTAGTTNDAGSSKISNIYRTGNVGIGLNTPLNKLVVRGVNAAASANGTVQSNATFRVDGDTNHALDMGTLSATPFGSYIQSHNKTAAFGLALSLNPSGGNVGIGTSTPATTLQINHSLIATNTVNANAQVLRLSRPTTSNIKWDNIAQFNIGSYSTAIAANSRLDLALTNGLNATDLTNVMTWQANGNVGINNTAPSAPLVVQGVTGTGALKLIAPSVAAGDNWWLGFGHGTTSTDANDRARIGVDMAGGGSGRLFFTTGLSGSQTRAMYIDEGQRVGIGTSSPTGQLEVATTNGLSAIIRRASNASYTSANLILQKTFSTDPAVSTALPTGEYIGRILFSASNGTTSYPGNGTDIVGFAYGAQSASNNGGGLLFRTVPQNTNPLTTPTERMKIDHNGNVGIGFVSPATGITAPASILDVSSTSSGVLVPRMTTVQRTAITLTTALKGMLVFDTDVNMFYYNIGTTWSPINVGTIKTIIAAYTLLPEDNGRVLDVTSASAMTITVPNTLPVGFQVSITQAGAGQVTITGGTGMTVNNRYLATKTSGQWAKAGLEVRASGSSVLSGDVQ
jgi:hypothetical protein